MFYLVQKKYVVKFRQVCNTSRFVYLLLLLIKLGEPVSATNRLFSLWTFSFAAIDKIVFAYYCLFSLADLSSFLQLCVARAGKSQKLHAEITDL